MSCCGRPSKQRARRPMRTRIIRPKAKVRAKAAPIRKFLMCRPNHFRVSYEINPWMRLANGADPSVAKVQYDGLLDRIREHGGEVVFLKDRPGLPDMVFTANAGLILPGKRVIVSNFLHPERKGEEEWFVQWFVENGYEFFYPAHPFEGAGDALFLNDTLILGHGFRSDREAHQMVASLWGGLTVSARLTDPRFYHLDTCFCPLDGPDYLIHPAAFDADSLANIRAIGGVELAVPEAEAARFACNAVVIGRTVLLPAGCPETMQILERAGYTPVAVGVSEFQKAGGACKCLTLAVS